VTSKRQVFAYLRAASAVLVLLAVGALVPATASAKEQCWQELVDDWSDGAISNLYPIRCYRQALQNMPEDVRLYSSASDDINRALSGRVVSRSLAGSSAKGASHSPAAVAATADDGSGMPLVLGGSLAALLVLGGATGYYTQRKWRGAARLRAPSD
jgi:hypothetical protein